ncbi:MAG: hypothetical protein AAGK47_03650 [Bacteroidota bacterium]
MSGRELQTVIGLTNVEALMFKYTERCDGDDGFDKYMKTPAQCDLSVMELHQEA